MSSRGFAVILALLITAMITIIASRLIYDNDIKIQRLERKKEHAQLHELNQAALNWARVVLQEDARQAHADHLGEIWATPLKGSPIEGYAFEGGLQDAQAGYNLNNLLHPQADLATEQRHLHKLLQIIGLPDDLLNALLAKRQQPYTPIMHLSELAAWPNISTETRQRISPYVSALPTLTLVNINTTRPEVLAAVVDNMTLSEARTFLLKQRLNPLMNSLSLFNALNNYPTNWIRSLGIHSNYFILIGKTSFRQAKQPIQALLERKGSELPCLVWLSSE